LSRISGIIVRLWTAKAAEANPLLLLLVYFLFCIRFARINSAFMCSQDQTRR
jgi:hypothetical protein